MTSPAVTAATHVVLVPRLRVVRFEPAESPLPRPARPEPLPADTAEKECASAHRVVARTIRLALEVLDHRRSPNHLAGLLTSDALTRWQELTRRRRVRDGTRLLRLRLASPLTGVVEAVAVCGIGHRAAAVAGRFDRTPAGWRCSVLHLC